MLILNFILGTIFGFGVGMILICDSKKYISERSYDRGYEDAIQDMRNLLNKESEVEEC